MERLTANNRFLKTSNVWLVSAQSYLSWRTMNSGGNAPGNWSVTRTLISKTFLQRGRRKLRPDRSVTCGETRGISGGDSIFIFWVWIIRWGFEGIIVFSTLLKRRAKEIVSWNTHPLRLSIYNAKFPTFMFGYVSFFVSYEPLSFWGPLMAQENPSKGGMLHHDWLTGNINLHVHLVLY